MASGTYQSYHLSLITKDQLSFSVRTSRGKDFVGQAGSVCVFRSGYEETHFAIAGSKFEAIVVELDPTRLETLLERPASASTDTLAPQIVVRDRYMAMLLRAMASEVAQGCPAGALYGQVPGSGNVSRAKIFGEWPRRQEKAPEVGLGQ